MLGHPFNSLQEWDPAHETSLELEHLWQIPPGNAIMCHTRRVRHAIHDVCDMFESARGLKGLQSQEIS